VAYHTTPFIAEGEPVAGRRSGRSPAKGCQVVGLSLLALRDLQGQVSFENLFIMEKFS